MGKAEKRLIGAQALLADAAPPPRPRIRLPALGRRDGVPADWPADALTIVVADEGVVAALRARAAPADARQSLGGAGGSTSSTARCSISSPGGRRCAAANCCRSLLSPAALRTALAFLFISRGGPWPLEAIGQDRESGGGEAENKRNIAHHYDVSNAFYRLWLDEEMVYTCGYFHDWGDSLDEAQAQQARHGLPQAAPSARRNDARHRQRLGRARLPRRAQLRRQGSRRHAVARSRSPSRARRPSASASLAR